MNEGLATHTVTVDLGERSYPIYIGEHVLKDADVLRRHVVGKQVAVISNEVVAPLYLDSITHALQGLQIDVHTLADGEQYKNLESYARIMDFLMSNRHNRSTTVIALGGGVVGDIAGFVAATYQRGVGFIQIPTTLLAQVDSSVGGKTAVNHPSGKNMIGAFYQPRCVIADTSVLHSLQPRELGAGLAEVIKYGLVADAEFFDWLETSMVNLGDGDRFALGRAIRRSCEIKAEVVAEDERESGIRAILNFGHTFAHAIEMLTEYRTLLHGEAVAIGMVMAADLSARQGLTSWNEARRIRQVIAGFGLPVQPPTLASEDMLGAMGMDKKIVDGTLRLVLLKSVGRVVVTQEIDPAALRETLTAADSLCNG